MADRPGSTASAAADNATKHEPVDQWLHRELLAEYGPDGDAGQWSRDQVDRVMERLQRTRGARPPLRAEVLWLRAPTAFTVPGQWVYVSRQMIERCASDDPVAFVLAHEIAHHDLGHFHELDDAAAGLAYELEASRAGHIAATVAILMIERRIHGPEHEAAADARAFAMCLDAGYDAERCIHALDILEANALDRGDTDAVFGLEDANDPDVREAHPWLLNARVWAWERLRGYLPLRERKARLRALAKARRR
jgi:predicted Zn-dependent protease